MLGETSTRNTHFNSRNIMVCHTVEYPYFLWCSSGCKKVKYYITLSRNHSQS